MAENEEIELVDFDGSRYKIYTTKNDHKIPTIVGICFVFVLFGLYGAVYLIDGILPRALTISDEIKHPDAFIAERAQQDLKFLTGLGPRIAGSYKNEAMAVEFLQQKLEDIQKQAHPNHKIDIDLQNESGFYESYHAMSINAKNVQNIVVKLHSKNNSAHSLLFNSHFDSAPTSPGGSDDGINCAIMLEVLRIISRSSTTFEHNIIFLFNGAEEDGLNGVKAFIQHHKWADEINIVINLEAAGAGGKIMLFQMSPEQSWLLNYYQKVPYPHAQVAGEEIYLSGKIPSNTDFSVFKSYGIIGLDLAFIKDGYRYHTKYDGFENIPVGSFQHVGANVLSLARNLANAPELANLQDQPNSKAVFYDFFGLFLISYTETTAILIHAITSMVSIIVAIKCFYSFKSGSTWKKLILYIAMSLGVILLGWITGGILIAVVALSINGLNFSMSWYGSPWFILGLYIVPAFTCSCVFIALLSHFKLKCKVELIISAQAQIQAQLLRLIWTIILITATILRIRSAYLIFLPVLFHTVASAAIQILGMQHSIWRWQIIYILGTIIPVIFLMQFSLTIISFIIPLVGRTSDGFGLGNSELPIGILSLLLTLLITSVYTPLITLLRRPFIFLLILKCVFLIFFIMVFTPLGFPYSANPNSPAPQRLLLYYSTTKVYYAMNTTQETKSRFLSVCEDGDPRNTLKIPLDKLKSHEDVDATRDEKGKIQSLHQIYMYEDFNIKLNSETRITNTLTRFNFTALGPSNMQIRISVDNSTTLTAINLPSSKLNINSSYFTSYLLDKEEIPLNFSLIFQTSNNYRKPGFKVLLTGTYNYIKISDNDSNTLQKYKRFVNILPEYVNLDARTIIRESWVNSGYLMDSSTSSSVGHRAGSIINPRLRQAHLMSDRSTSRR